MLHLRQRLKVLSGQKDREAPLFEIKIRSFTRRSPNPLRPMPFFEVGDVELGERGFG